MLKINYPQVESLEGRFETRELLKASSEVQAEGGGNQNWSGFAGANSGPNKVIGSEVPILKRLHELKENYTKHVPGVKDEESAKDSGCIPNWEVYPGA